MSRRALLADHAPDLPGQLPPKLRGKPLPLTRVVEPFVEKRFRDDERFRACSASFNPANSPNGRVCFDDKDRAEIIKQDGEKAGVERIVTASVAAISTAISRVMTARGLGRRQRLTAARNNLLTAAQPAE